MASLIFALIFSMIPSIFGLNILIIVPGWSSSHIMFNYRLADMLINRGHRVTALVQIMTDVQTKGAPRGLDVMEFLPENTSEIRSNIQKTWQEFAFQDSNFTNINEVSVGMRKLILQTCDQILSDHQLIDNLRSKEFHITLSHFFSYCPAGISHRIGVRKFVWIASAPFITENIHWRLGLPFITSYMPNHMNKAAHDRMAFMERLRNFFWSSLMAFWDHKPEFMTPTENGIFKKPPYHSDSDPDLWTLLSETKTILINGEPYLDFPKPLLPGMLHLGDLEHKEIKKLPEEWRKIMDDSNEGVILFSFGTVANTTLMPLKLKEAFFNAFKKFPQHTILWRLEGEIPNGLSQYPHIRLVKWIPQSDLLNHKNMKIFITHGGYNSFLESAQAGVPMILMPLLIDQYANAERAKTRGIGVILDKLKADSLAVENAISTILYNTSYAKNAKHVASTLQDQIIATELSAAHQIERIAKSGRHWPTMKVAQKLTWIQYFCFDVAVFLFSLISTGIYAFFLICRLIWRVIQKENSK